MLHTHSDFAHAVTMAQTYNQKRNVYSIDQILGHGKDEGKLFPIFSRFFPALFIYLFFLIFFYSYFLYFFFYLFYFSFFFFFNNRAKDRVEYHRRFH